MRSQDAGLLLGFLLALGACSSGNDDGGAGTVAGTLAGVGGGVSAGSGTTGTAGMNAEPRGAYRVSIQATQTILCAGQCTEISAVAENGYAPYSYAWTQGVGEGEGPHAVCPEETTTYEVVATDTAFEDDEFGHPSESAASSLTLQVIDGDACALDGGVPIEQPEQRELCTIALPYEDPTGYPLLPVLSAGSTLGTDAEGNLYFAGQQEAAFDLGDGLNPSESVPSAFIAKYDATCEPIWIKRYAVPSQAVHFSSLAIGPSGELVVVGWMVGNGTFDAVTTTDRPADLGTALMITFDSSDGTALTVTSPGMSDQGSGLFQATFDADGDLVISGWVGARAAFDGADLGNDEPGALIAKLSVVGNARDLRFAQVFSGTESFSQIATGASGIAVTTLRNGSVLSYDGTAIDYPFVHRFAALLDRSGALQWSRNLDADLEPKSQPGIGMIDFDSAGNVLVSHGNFVSDEPRIEEPELLTKLAPDGTELGVWVVAPPGSRPDQLDTSHLQLDPLDNVVHLTTIANETDTPGDAGIRAEGKVPNDVVVQKLTPDGSLIWRHRFDTDVFEMAWGLALGPDGSIWVGHGEDADADPFSGTLLITKLAP